MQEISERTKCTVILYPWPKLSLFNVNMWRWVQSVVHIRLQKYGTKIYYINHNDRCQVAELETTSNSICVGPTTIYTTDDIKNGMLCARSGILSKVLFFLSQNFYSSVRQKALQHVLVILAPPWWCLRVVDAFSPRSFLLTEYVWLRTLDFLWKFLSACTLLFWNVNILSGRTS